MTMHLMPLACMVWVVLLVQYLQVCFATSSVTGVGGAEGALYGDWHQLWVQIEATLISILYSAVVTYLLYILVDKFIGMRVCRRVEEEGLDIYEHGESAYN